jgi:hypothetical protein
MVIRTGSLVSCYFDGYLADVPRYGIVLFGSKKLDKYIILWFSYPNQTQNEHFISQSWGWRDMIASGVKAIA